MPTEEKFDSIIRTTRKTGSINGLELIERLGLNPATDAVTIRSKSGQSVSLSTFKKGRGMIAGDFTLEVATTEVLKEEAPEPADGPLQRKVKTSDVAPKRRIQ